MRLYAKINFFLTELSKKIKNLKSCFFHVKIMQILDIRVFVRKKSHFIH